MPTQTITIEVDVPEGWEATGEYRRVTRGERYLTCANGVQYVGTWCPKHEPSGSKYIVLRKAWQPEPWMPEGSWVYKSEWGSWFLSDTAPDCPHWREGTGFPIANLSKLFGWHFTPPPVDKIQVRHKKEETQ